MKVMHKNNCIYFNCLIVYDYICSLQSESEHLVPYRNELTYREVSLAPCQCSAKKNQVPYTTFCCIAKSYGFISNLMIFNISKPTVFKSRSTARI